MQPSKEIAPKCGESARVPDGEKSVESCHASGCHGFLVPKKRKSESKMSGRHEWRHQFIKAPKECSKKFAATFKGKFITGGNVRRIVFLFLEDFGAPPMKGIFDN